MELKYYPHRYTSSQIEPKYYSPSPNLVNFLQKELRGLQKSEKGIAGKGDQKSTFIRMKDKRGKIAKNKGDLMERIFQSFADIVYFLEFIQEHPELHELYEKDLKDLFGINKDPDSKPYHHKNPGGTLERMVRAILLIEVGERRELDFRAHIIKRLIWCCIEAMRSRITDESEIQLMISDTRPTWLWSDTLSNRVKVDAASPRRRFGFCTLKYEYV